MSESYKRTYSPNHPNSGSQGKILTHRLVMSKHLGRPLEDSEVVHHIDGNKRNNDISNLQLMSARAHHIEHYAERGNDLIEASKTPEAIEKRKKTFKRIGHQQGKKNSNYGKMWVTDGSNNRMIKKDEQIPEGWQKGRNC